MKYGSPEAPGVAAGEAILRVGSGRTARFYFLGGVPERPLDPNRSESAHQRRPLPDHPGVVDRNGKEDPGAST